MGYFATLSNGSTGVLFSGLNAGLNASDAVNVSQLGGVTQALGAGASVDSTSGSIVAPSYAIGGATYNDVGSALVALNSAGQDAVKYDSSGHSSVTLGAPGAEAPVGLHNVAKGDVSSESTDAVNGSQLYQVSNSVTNINNTLTTAGWGAQASSTNPGSYEMGGFIIDGNGHVSNPSVLYVPNTIGTANAQIVLDPGQGNSEYFVNGDRTQGYLPKGTVISNLADGIQNTDAANLGQVYTIVAQAGGGGGGSGGGSLVKATRQLQAPLGASSSGSGVNTSGLVLTYNTAAYYSQVSGLADSSGSTKPSDVARAYGNGSIAIGSNSYVPSTAPAGTAIGVQSYTSANDAVALGSGSVANVANTVSVGNDGTSSYTAYYPNGQTYTIKNQANTRRIVNMAAGQADTDAVNVSQLKGVTAALGGGASVNADGSIAAPSYSVAGNSYSDAGSAIAALNNGSVAYDTSAHDIVTLAGSGASKPVKLTNLANGALNAASSDAVNGSQLFATNQSISTLSGTVTNIAGDVTNLTGQMADAVKYDTSAHDIVTMGGTDAEKTVKLTNIANGALNASSTDAVNGSQLFATNASISTLSGAVTNIAGDVTNIAGQVADAVKYDTSAHDVLTLGGADAEQPVKLTNVANGTLNASSTDAVNGSQLFATNTSISTLSGAVTNIAGDVTNLSGQVADAVKYDTSAHDVLTLGGTDAEQPVKLTNVGNGALNASSTDAVNGSQLFATNTSISTLSGAVTNIAGDVTNLTGQVADAVKYDSSAHTSVTLGGDGASAPVALHNVASGLEDNDAVNLSQLKSAGFAVDPATGTVLNKAVTYDAGSIDSGSPTITLEPGQGNSPYFRNSNRADGYLPAGTVISNVGVGIQDTDAANVGQVYDIVSGKDGGGVAQLNLRATTLGASSSGSGVNTSGLVLTYNTAAYYSQVSGLADSSGSTKPSDVARAFGNGSIAIGSNSYVTSGAPAGTAIGVQSYTSANDAVALGSGSVANVANTVSVGNDGTSSYTAYYPNGQTYTIKNQSNTRRIVNMAAGQADTDAVNVSQIKGVTTALGGGASVNADGSIAAPTYDVAGGTYNDVGTALAAIDAKPNTGSPDAVMYDSSSHTALTLGGTNAQSPVQLSNVANAVASHDAVNLAQLEAMGGTFDSSGNATNAFVAYDDASKSSVTFGGSGAKPTRLYNVAKGTISATSTDGINGSQLFGLAASTASALGGSTSVNADGSISNPTYVLNGATYGDVGKALDAVMDAAKGGGADAVVYNDASHTSVRLGGTNGTVPVALTNVANGVGANDAVNVAQLEAMGGSFDSSGNVTNAFVAYDDTSKSSVTLGGSGSTKAVALHNVANAAQANDAVNLAQLEAMGGTFDSSGNVTNAFVAYDDTSKSAVTFGGSGAAPVVLHNVANGSVANDAVNVAQLAAMGGTFDSSGNVTNAFVAYDDLSKSSVTLGGSGAAPVTLHNVANGSVANDAVNVVQLTAMGGTFDSSGNVTNAFVAYDDASKSSVTFGGSGAKPVRLYNIAAGTISANSTDGINGSQLFGLAASTASALGGSTSVNADGSISNPTYVLNGSTYGDVGKALDAVMDAAKGGGADAVVYNDASHTSVRLGGMNGTVPVALTNVANGVASNDAVNVAQLEAMGGSFDSSGNVTNAFVAYDDTSRTSVTLGGSGSTTPVALHNVANAAQANDAVNLAQLEAMGGTFDSSGNVTNAFVAYDDTSKSSVTFGGTGAAPVTLHNVANGSVANDAVNVAQLAAMGGTFDSSGNVTNAFVAYDDTSKSAVTFGGSGAAPVVLHNVANGSVANDAVNVAQLAAMGGTFDSSGNVTNAFVAYDDTSKSSVTLGGSGSTKAVALHNVANAAQANDAVNLAQLEAMGGSFDSSGNATNAFVTYDDTSKSSVTFGGAGATTPVVLHNVGAGAQDLDAVNVAQLKAAGLNVDTSGNVLNAFVSYDDTSKSSITLGGAGTTGLVALHNVANGVGQNDAVNVAQLQAMGATVDTSGNVTNSFVAYDDSSKSSITLGGSGHAPVKLRNIAAGDISPTSTDAVNGAQAYSIAASTASALGGGSTVNGDGSISAPTYSIGGNTYNNVGGAISNIDGRVTTIENSMTTIAGSVANAVQYDTSAHDKITLGGTSGTTAVALTNVANGVLSADSLDAVNGSQLYATNVQVANLNQAIENINISGSEYLATNTSNGAASATGTNSVAAGGGAIASGTNSTAIGDTAKATGNNSVALGANSVADQDNTVSVGSQGNERRITNVANGVNATDAVNVGQLQSGLNALQGNVNSVARNAYGGVAAATALTMIPDVDQGKNLAVGVGTANFQGYQAVALGASARITQNIKVKVGGGYASGGGATVGGGMAYQW
ncbi:YadA-like family protein [Paraburkholderia bannensis]|uniref:YadA-like family protein n=1 Tax=Paraburkholderia bannensis TaxID=765414 RepID=UPI002AAF5D3F|nr:YadA-like family protein [Paraburkholderia bannensis]